MNLDRPVAVAHGREGRRRPQLLARQPCRLRRHPDAPGSRTGPALAAGGGTQIELQAPPHQGRRARARASRTTPALFGRHRSYPIADAVLLALPLLGCGHAAVSRSSPPRDIDESYARGARPRSISTIPQCRAWWCACATSSTTAGAGCAEPSSARRMQAAIQALADQIPLDAGRSGADDQQGADSLRRHGRERRQPLRRQRDRACRSSRPAAARSPTTPAASSPRST